MVTLGTGSRLTRPRMSRHGLVVRAQLGVGVVIPALPVACEDLTVDVPHRRLEMPDAPRVEGRTLYPKRRRMTLRSRPGSGLSITVLAPHPVWLPLRYLGRRGDAVRVEARWGDGARLRGWVDLDEVAWRPATGYGATGGSGVRARPARPQTNCSGVRQGDHVRRSPRLCTAVKYPAID